MRLIDQIFRKRLSTQEGEPYSYLRTLLGFTPKDITLYSQALTHKSVRGRSNERLEYLGDALIGMVVAEELFRLFPNEGEGFLTRTRARAVCRENLNATARRIELDKHLQTGQPLKINSDNIFGNALEALTGAVFLDAGYDAAAQFIRKVLVGKNGRNLLRLAEHETDFKSRLLEYAQSKHLQVVFNMIGERYELHDDRHVFLFEVSIDGKVVAQAAGYSKREAQQTAARKALKSVSKES